MPGIPLIARGAFPASAAMGPQHPGGGRPGGGGGPGPAPPGLGPLDGAQAAEIQAYEPPWKALCDFALHSDLDKLNMANNPQYNQLVNQVEKLETASFLPPAEGGHPAWKTN